MPAYDFKCTACGDIFEITRPAGESAPVTCPACQSPAKKVFSPVGVHFKGSGFYNTDRQTGPTPAALAPAASTPDAGTPTAPAPAPACPAATGGSCASCPAAAGE
jgi:putative FmdB family regulatory protein